MVDNANRSNYREDYEAIRREAEADIGRELGQADRSGSVLGEPNLGELEDLATELGMEEVYLDEAELDAIPADDTDDNLDADDDGIVDESDDEEIIDDRPQEFTESYGTGLQGHPTDRTGRYSRRSDQHLYNEPDTALTGGDIDANYEDASVVGDEAVGGTVATPDQDIVDDIGVAAGVEMDDRSFLRVSDMLEQRDNQRWELEPKSSEDYEDRQD